MSGPRKVRLDGLPDGRHTRKVTHPTRGNDWPKDRWYVELIGEKHYPKTPESWQKRNDVLTANRAGAIAAGKMTRRGVPDGRAGQKGQLEVELRNAQTEAEMLVPVLFPDWQAGKSKDYKANEVKDYSLNGGLDLDEIARDMMTATVGIMRCVHNPLALRLSAARTVRMFTAGLPARVNIATATCESILAALSKSPG